MVRVNDFDGVIFDYGGVLVFHQTDAERSQMAALAGMQPSVFDERYWAERIAYDRGALTAAEYWSKVASNGEKSPDQKIVDELTELDTTSWMHYDSVMWKWIGELRQAGKSVAMLSNMPLDLGEALKSRTDRLDVFDHVTLSYELGVVKPDPVIYEQCLDGIGTSPEKTLFLDDRLENITGAEMLGIRGVQFTSRDEVLQRLQVNIL